MDNPMTPVPIQPTRVVSLMSLLKIHRPRPHFTARHAMAPAHDAAVREAPHVVDLSTVWADDGVWKVGGPAAAARQVAAIGPVGVAPFDEFARVRVHDSPDRQAVAACVLRRGEGWGE